MSGVKTMDEKTLNDLLNKQSEAITVLVDEKNSLEQDKIELEQRLSRLIKRIQDAMIECRPAAPRDK